MKNDNDALLDWLEEFRQPDIALEAAYEQTDPKFRAAIKTGVALAEFHFRPARASQECRAASVISGFQEKFLCRPCHLALIIMDASYGAAARLCAAACLPILSGVERTLTVITGPERAAPGILATLELCGVEDIYRMDYAQLGHLAAKIPSNAAVSLLHAGQLDALARALRQTRLRLHEECRPPSLLLLSPKSFDHRVLAFCQGVVPQTSWTPGDWNDCAYVEPGMAVDGVYANLFLEPGCEGFWLHGGLTPEFYSVCQKRFGFYNGD